MGLKLTTTKFVTLLSSHSCREMCCWDLIDGLCIESEKMVHIHSYIQASQVTNHHEPGLIKTFISLILWEGMKMHTCFVLETTLTFL